MKIVRFEPGDGTAYLVGLHVMTPDELKEVGGFSHSGVWFTFGGSSCYDLRTHPFQAYGYLDFGYYVEKMTPPGKENDNMYTHAVGHRVLCYITGRDEGTHRPERIAQWMHYFEQWEEGWRSQLVSLMQEALLIPHDPVA